MGVLYDKLKAHYESVKPIRGWSTDCRPFGNRRRQNELVDTVVGIRHQLYTARHHNTHVLTIEPGANGEDYVTIDLSYNSMTTRDFLMRVLNMLDLHWSHIGILQRHGRAWARVAIKFTPGYRPYYVYLPIAGKITLAIDKHKDTVREAGATEYVKLVANREARKPVYAAARQLRKVIDSVLALSEGTLQYGLYHSLLSEGEAYVLQHGTIMDASMSAAKETESVQLAVALWLCRHGNYAEYWGGYSHSVESPPMRIRPDAMNAALIAAMNRSDAYMAQVPLSYGDMDSPNRAIFPKHAAPRLAVTL